MIVERGALRFTPAGIPALDVSLRHESETVELGQRRKVSLELRGKALGELAQKLLVAELGSPHEFAGFVGSQRNGRGVVFHIQAIESK